MKLVRGSEVQDFLRCRLRWKYAWVDGYKSKKQNDKLFIGTLIHKYLEAHYNSLDEMDSKFALDQGFIAMKKLYDETDLSKNDPLEVQDMWEMADKVTQNYVKHWGQEPIEVIATELTFAIPLDDEIVYTGTIDLIYKDQEGNLWFSDHKSTDSLDKYEKNAIMDRQISRYWWAIQQLAKGNGYILHEDKWLPVEIWNNFTPEGVGAKLTEPYGFHYNLIKKDVPQPPKQLKNGSLSKAKDQNTTLELYMQTLKDMNLLKYMDEERIEFPDEYTDILDHLANNGKQYFRRIEVIRNQREIDSAMQEFYAVAVNKIEVQDLAENGVRLDSSDKYATAPYNPIYRNITADCHWDCSFKDVCHAGMDGSDVEYLLNIAFEKEQPNNEFNS